MANPFGELLKHWRERRRMSQLDLGLAANVSARHISFLETGRSRPSRPMVIGLCDALGVPRAEQNGFLLAAGFAPAYRSRTLDDPELQPVREAIARLIAAHEPFPALVLGRHWSILDANRTAAALMQGLGLHMGQSLIDLAHDRNRLEQIATNPAEVAAHFISRLRTEARHAGGDDILTAAADALQEQWPDLAAAPLPPVIPFRVHSPLGPLSFISLIAQFGSAEDIFLADLKVELLYPGDGETTSRLVAMMGR